MAEMFITAGLLGKKNGKALENKCVCIDTYGLYHTWFISLLSAHMNLQKSTLPVPYPLYNTLSIRFSNSRFPFISPKDKHGQYFQRQVPPKTPKLGFFPIKTHPNLVNQ